MSQFIEKFHTQTAHWARLATRRKTDEDDAEAKKAEGSGQLSKCLGLWDLTMLGVGTTLGVGVYVLAGIAARKDAGPAVVLSFLIAAIASALAGLCYAEFAARVPRAGSAYIYSYVTVGELAAFLIGWNIILEYVIGNASVARAFIELIDDQILNRAMSKFLSETMPIHVSWLSSYPDFLSFIVILLLSVLIAWGVRESTYLNNFFTTANLITVGIVIFSGAFYFDLDNWRIPKADIPEYDVANNKTVINGGEGGFFPFGITGVMAGAARCFYGFVGFDCVATMGEEAKNAKRDIPLAIVLCLLITCFTYLGIASTLTLMLPYYFQNTNAPIPYVFEYHGQHFVQYLVLAGSLFAVFTGLLGGMFPMPRVLYAMSYDGLLFKSLKSINPRTRTPVVATMVAGVFAGVMACFFNLSQLMDMMSIGTLLAYTIVALCVLILRYRNQQNAIEEPAQEDCCCSFSFGDLFNSNNLRLTNQTTEAIALWALSGFMLLTGGFCLVVDYLEDYLSKGDLWAVALTSVFAVLIVVLVFVLWRQPQAPTNLTLKVPLVPFVPCASILINFYLMAKLDVHTWIRFIVWLVIGMLIYIFYSIPNSVAGQRARLLEAEKLRNSQAHPLLESPPHSPENA